MVAGILFGGLTQRLIIPRIELAFGERLKHHQTRLLAGQHIGINAFAVKPLRQYSAIMLHPLRVNRLARKIVIFQRIGIQIEQLVGIRIAGDEFPRTLPQHIHGHGHALGQIFTNGDMFLLRLAFEQWQQTAAIHRPGQIIGAALLHNIDKGRQKVSQ